MLGLVDENAVNQWINKNGWKVEDTGYVLISNQVIFISLEVLHSGKVFGRFFDLLIRLNAELLKQQEVNLTSQTLALSKLLSVVTNCLIKKSSEIRYNLQNNLNNLDRFAPGKLYFLIFLCSFFGRVC
jgi:hypothetical protein